MELAQLEEKLTPFIEEAKKWRKPLRIGTNHGSLSDRILNRYGDTPLGMVESTLEYLRIFRKHGFEDIIVGLKASDPMTLIEANRLLRERLDTEAMDYPVHLGVTEAGNGDEGRVKSTLGIATLLLDGIGDTIRVSLTEDPVREIPVAYAILQATHRRITRAEFISCPSCGRTYYDLETVTNAIKQRLGHLRGVRIGIMGCIVNGVGEMAGADFGYVGGAPGKVNLFVGKECVKRHVPEEDAVDALIALIKTHGKWQEPESNTRAAAGVLNRQNGSTIQSENTPHVFRETKKIDPAQKKAWCDGMKILLAKPRGFCAGVDRAVDSVELALAHFGPPVYMRHQIVHSPYVVRQLEEKGAVFVERTEDIPEGSVAILSAHGVSPAVIVEAKTRKLRVIDATCPLVKKVHFEAKFFAAKGYTILLIGHRGHVEVEGTSGEAPEATRVIETADEVRTLELPDPAKTVVLTQTTLSVDDTADIIRVLRERFPALTLPPKEDICYATTNRQAAVKNLAERVQLFLVLGAPESSNTTRLVETAKRNGIPAHCIQRAADIAEAWLEGTSVVGVTAGASAPEVLVVEVLDWLRAHGATEVEEVTTVVESMQFTLPPVLADAVRANPSAAALLEKHTIRRAAQ